MSEYSFTVTKTGAVYYYKIEDGKKVRVSKDSVPTKTIDKSKAKTAAVTKKSAVKKSSPELPKKSKTKKSSPELPKKSKTKKSAVVSKILKIVKTKEPPKIIVCQFGRGVAYPKKEGFKVYPIHSRGAKPWKELSPFFIGPVSFINADGEEDSCPIFESYWQSCKVWKTVSKQNQKKPEWLWPAEKHLGKDGNPNKAWYKWHDALCHHEKAVRRPNGKAIPEYAWWMNKNTGEYEKLNTIEARKKIYIPILKKLYRAHPVYKRLLKEFRNGQNMILIEPDGPWNVAYPNGREVNLDLLYSLIEKMNYAEEEYPKHYAPYGHSYIAATCLLEDF